MNNVIYNVKYGATSRSYPNQTGFNLALAKAKDNKEKTGNKTIVIRILDYVDQFDGRDREHYSFDVVELISN